MVFQTGPYLAVAALCEKVIEDKQGVLSLIRIVDRIVANVVAPDVPAAMPPIPVSLTAVVILRSGEARGRHSLKIRLEEPSGLQQGTTEIPVFFEGEDRGMNAVIPLQIVAREEGLYWFDVLVNDELLSRIPLRLIYQPQRLG
jgi:hypothetical protein